VGDIARAAAYSSAMQRAAPSRHENEADMSTLTRRTFSLGVLSATAAVAGCANGIGGRGAADIDARVDETLTFMYNTFPGTRSLSSQAKGTLVMPVMTEVGFGIGGSFGRGALRVGPSTVDYYSVAAASAGFQLGAQQFSHVLFFMTEEALQTFRTASGWTVGADVEYALNDTGEMLRADTTTTRSPVIAVVFGQAGFRVGATLEGAKYSRIIP